MSPPAARRAAAQAAKQAARSAAAAAATTSSSPSAAASQTKPTPKWKYMLYTATFAAVTFTGTIYGAGLKTQQEWKEEKQRVQEASIDEKVSLLEQRRTELMRQKGELESKLGGIRARMRANAAAEAETAAEGRRAR